MALESSKQVLGSTLRIGDVIEFPPGDYDPPQVAVVSRVNNDDFEILTTAGETESGLELGKYYLLAGRACDPNAADINGFATALPRMREQLKDAKFHLEIFAAMAIREPVPQNGFRFTWNDPHPDGKSIWHAEGGVFKIEKDPTKQNYPYTLTMTVKDTRWFWLYKQRSAKSSSFVMIAASCWIVECQISESVASLSPISRTATAGEESNACHSRNTEPAWTKRQGQNSNNL
jgi:hypothetical protein